MRLVTTLLVILSLVVGSGLWFTHSLKTSARELAEQIDRVSLEIKGERWDLAQVQSQELESTWAQKAKWWPIFLDHQEMDNIEFSLARIKGYVGCQDNSLSLGQLSELRLMIEHLPCKEAVNLKNIF